jgi:hypothetical protein
MPSPLVPRTPCPLVQLSMRFTEFYNIYGTVDSCRAKVLFSWSSSRDMVLATTSANILRMCVMSLEGQLSTHPPSHKVEF